MPSVLVKGCPVEPSGSCESSSSTVTAPLEAEEVATLSGNRSGMLDRVRRSIVGSKPG
jgi:hypothetical protein